MVGVLSFIIIPKTIYKKKENVEHNPDIFITLIQPTYTNFTPSSFVSFNLVVNIKYITSSTLFIYV